MHVLDRSEAQLVPGAIFTAPDGIVTRAGWHVVPLPEPIPMPYTPPGLPCS